MILEDTELMRLFLPILRADFAVCETYEYEAGPPLRCPITVISGEEDPTTNRNGLDAWRDQTNAALSRHMVPGDHFYLNSAQPVLLRLLSQALLQHTRTVPFS